MLSSSAIKLGKEEGRGDFGVIAFVLSIYYYCLPMRIRELIPDFALLVHPPLLYLYANCLYPKPLVFSVLPLWLSLSTMGEWASGCVGLSCPPGLKHNKRVPWQPHFKQNKTEVNFNLKEAKNYSLKKSDFWTPECLHRLNSFSWFYFSSSMKISSMQACI